MQRSISQQASVDLARYLGQSRSEDDRLEQELTYLAKTHLGCTLVTSYIPAVGKSTISAHIAISLAMQGLSTILVEADLRTPRLGMSFKVSNYSGLSKLLTDSSVEIEDCVEKSSIPNLSILVSGRLHPHPRKLLGGSKFKELISSLKEKYQAVVIDAPSLQKYSDASIIADEADNVVIIMQKDHLGFFNNSIADRMGSNKSRIRGQVIIDENGLTWRYAPVLENTLWNQQQPQN